MELFRVFLSFVFTSRDASKSGNDEEEDHSAGKKKKKKKEHERMNVHAPAFVPRKRRGQEEEPRRTDANDADDAEGKDGARTLGKNRSTSHMSWRLVGTQFRFNFVASKGFGF